MSKAQTEKIQSVPLKKSGAQMAKTPPRTERTAETIKLVEIRTGLFLNVDQIVSVRVLPQEEGNTHAILQLSNGDKLDLTRIEFTAISGEEPRLPVRLLQNPLVE